MQGRATVMVSLLGPSVISSATSPEDGVDFDGTPTHGTRMSALVGLVQSQLEQMEGSIETTVPPELERPAAWTDSP